MISWLNPSLLFWGVLALTPLVLHLWNRRPVQTLFLPTLRFLTPRSLLVARRKKIQEYFLLFFRILLLLLFAVILARPYSPAPLPSSKSSDPEKIVCILDDSLSTSYEVHGRSLFQSIQKEALSFLEKLPSELPVALYFTNQEFTDFTLDRLSLQKKILKKRSLSHGLSFKPLVQTLLKRLESQNVEIFLFIDRTRRALEGVPRSPLLRFVDCGNATPLQSSALHFLKIVSIPQQNQAVEIEFGGLFCRTTTAYLKVNGQIVQSQTLEGKTQQDSYRFSYVPPHLGNYWIEVFLEKDALEADHHWYGAFQLQKPLRLLLLGERIETLLVEKAFLATGAYEVFRISPTLLKKKEGESYDLCCIIDDGKYSPETVEYLERFLNQGIPLLYYAYQPSPLLPLKLFQGIDIQEIQTGSFALDFRSTLFPESLLVEPRLESYFPFKSLLAEPLLRLQNGDPLIAEFPKKRIWIGSLSLSSWVISPLFPILQEVLGKRLSTRPYVLNGEVGLPYFTEGEEFEVVSPSGHRCVLARGQSLVETWELGLYHLFFKEKSPQLLCINPPVEEFNLQTWTREELEKQWGVGVFRRSFFLEKETAPEWAFFLAYLLSVLLVVETFWSNAQRQ
jgi:hypothetical protein